MNRWKQHVDVRTSKDIAGHFEACLCESRKPSCELQQNTAPAGWALKASSCTVRSRPIPEIQQRPGSCVRGRTVVTRCSHFSMAQSHTRDLRPPNLPRALRCHLQTKTLALANLPQPAAARFPTACSSVALASESRHYPVRLMRPTVVADRQPPGHQALFVAQERTPRPTRHANCCLGFAQPRSKVTISILALSDQTLASSRVVEV